MRGTPYTYYGDELGMTNIDMPTIEEYVDIDALGKYRAALAANADMDEFMKVLNYSSRENGRTPMQWDDSENAGFTTGTPWKRVNENYKDINVAAQDKDPNSVLNHFRKMVKLRNDNKVLVYGDYQLIQEEHPDIYAYTRILDNQKMLVLLNFTDHNSTIQLSEANSIQKTLINNYESLSIENDKITLESYQSVILSID
jgi:oligo-1,6-glucosidase